MLQSYNLRFVPDALENTVKSSVLYRVVLGFSVLFLASTSPLFTDAISLYGILFVWERNLSRIWLRLAKRPMKNLNNLNVERICRVSLQGRVFWLGFLRGIKPS